MWIQKISFSFLLAVFLVGCGSSRINLKPNEKLITQSFSVTIPDNGWYTFGTVESRLQRERGYDRISFDRDDRIRKVFSVETGFLDYSDYQLLNKDKHKNLEETLANEKTSEKYLKRYQERGISYYKDFVDYMANLKCITFLTSQNIANGVGTKNYRTICNYYDKQGLAKRLSLDYWYIFTFGNTTFKGSNSPSLKIATMKELQEEFKQHVKKIADSIDLFDMDKERMKKEGLYYNRKYDVNDEFKIKGRRLDCGVSKITNRWECEEKIADY